MKYSNGVLFKDKIDLNCMIKVGKDISKVHKDWKEFFVVKKPTEIEGYKWHVWCQTGRETDGEVIWPDDRSV